MTQQIDDLFATAKGLELYHQAVALYDKVELEHAHIAEVNGIRMGYLDFGPADGIPLIWAHGSGGTGYEILVVQEGLVAAGYRVISIDYRGHGKTQIDVTPYNTSLYHIADDIAALMDHLGIDKAVVGGLSKGGRVASAFYDAYSARVLGLLLEDGGSWSSIRLIEDIQLGVIPEPPASPTPAEACQRLFTATARFQTRLDGLAAAWAVYSHSISPSRQQQLGADFFATLLSVIQLQDDGSWAHHCDVHGLMCGDESGRAEDGRTTQAPFYSRLPIMQQSQELMIPSVIFRNLAVPVHIIDPVSPTDWLPVRHLNEELQAQHPDWIVHEVYDYEHSPHAAHIERPERFIESAEALLARVKTHACSET